METARPETAPHPFQLLAVAKALSDRRDEVSRHFFEPIADWEKWTPQIEALGAERLIELEVKPQVDYLINYLRTGDPVWSHLYLGHQIEQLGWPADDRQAMLARRRSVLSHHRERLLQVLAPVASAGSLELFDRRLEAIHDIALQNRDSDMDAHILMIGDCYLAEVAYFLVAELAARGVNLRVEHVQSKNPAELRDELRKFAETKFDLICYSPYTYEFAVGLRELYSNPNPLQSRTKLRKLAESVHRQTQTTLRLLCELFETTICVQNTSNIRRNDGSSQGYVKDLVTRRPRRIVANEINALLYKLLSEMSRVMPRPPVTVDEAALAEQFGEFFLGRKVYSAQNHHPTVLAQEMSVKYRSLILSSKQLFTKKVVLIDLDDTVWKGTIGEGAVEHYMDRQRVLGDLRWKGVLLGIVSKNDPQKVHWRGGLLEPKDFVAQQINWEPKPINIRRIASELNLHLKDFVFIDDRADQREIVKLSIPEIEVLDAVDETTWEMLRGWERSLPEQRETDRTQIYHEREKRESFLKNDGESVDQAALFGSLGLTASLRPATRKELPRVAELINRTNQFNTGGSRVTLPQISALWQASEHSILVAEMRDKFGEMGVISAMIVDFDEDNALAIRAWVLSCRVFGYGVEASMLNYVRRVARHLKREAVHGRIVETAHNQPCRQVYAANGFVNHGGVWIADSGIAQPEATWLKVTSSHGNTQGKRRVG